VAQVIELSGYTGHEKRHIARLYLEKEVRKTCAIPEGSVEITDEAMETIIQQYCRESGVRNLKKQIEKIYRKTAMTLATSDQLEVGTLHWVSIVLECRSWRLDIRLECLNATLFKLCM
jgi:ATP-dependent Lon protease